MSRAARVSFRQQQALFFSPSHSRALRQRIKVSQPRPGPRGKVTAARTVLRAGALGTVVLALSQPLQTIIPQSHDNERFGTWDNASKSGRIEDARQAAWLEVRLWLESYFLGSVVDEGPVNSDIFVFPGLYVLAADTRIFWIPIPEGVNATMPTVCLGVNSRLRGTSNQGNMYDEHERLDEVLIQLEMNKLLLWLEERLIQWQDEGRLKSCCVIVRHIDFTSYLVFQDGEFHNWEPGNPTPEDESDDIILG